MKPRKHPAQSKIRISVPGRLQPALVDLLKELKLGSYVQVLDARHKPKHIAICFDDSEDLNGRYHYVVRGKSAAMTPERSAKLMLQGIIDIICKMQGIPGFEGEVAEFIQRDRY
jgi:hypothetical protein